MQGRDFRCIEMVAIASVCLIAMQWSACAGRRHSEATELAKLAAGADLTASPFHTPDKHEPPALTASPMAIDFGRVRVREDKLLFVTLANPTNLPLTVRWVSTGNLGDYFFSSDVEPGRWVVPANGRTQLTVAFAPKTAVRIDSTLTIETDSPVGPFTRVSLTGIGTR